MQYGPNNGIGAFVAITIGVSAFAGWLYVCYPATAQELAGESQQSWSFLVLLGFVVVAVFGVTLAGSVLHGVMMMLRSLVQLSLIVAVVIGGVMLWRRESPPQYRSQPLTVQQPLSPPVSPRITPPTINTRPQPKPSQGRWWDQK